MLVSAEEGDRSDTLFMYKSGSDAFFVVAVERSALGYWCGIWNSGACLTLFPRVIGQLMIGAFERSGLGLNVNANINGNTNSRNK